MSIIMYEGQKGAGKTFLMTKDGIKLHRTEKIPIKADYKLEEVDYRHFYLLHEIFGTTGHLILFDEIQKKASCRRGELPAPFEEMVAGDRHDLNTMLMSTQNFWHVDKRIRDNTDKLIKVKKIFKWPPQQEKKAVFQWSVYWACERKETPSGLIRWKKKKRYNLFITKWSELLYNTHEKIQMANYKWRLNIKKKKCLLRIVSRHLIETGRKRL